jgi:hypothetical protein
MSLKYLRTPRPAGVKLSSLDWIKFIWMVFKIIPALIRNRASVVDARLTKVLVISHICIVKAD